MFLPHFCEVLFYTLKGRRCIYVVETVYIIRSQPRSHSHYEQIMQTFHPRHPVLMYLSSPQQKSCEVEIAIFPDIFMTQQTEAK